MTNDTFISTAEAAELIGASTKTAIRRGLGHLKNHRLSLEEATDMMEMRKVGGRNTYYFSKEFVLRHLVSDGGVGQRSKSKETGYATRQLLRQLEMKDQQLDKKDAQIAEKDRQIGNLSERLREAHVLVKNEQDSLKTEQQLHLATQSSRRPLLSFAGKTSVSGNVQPTNEEGSRTALWRRAAVKAAVGFTTLAVTGSLIYSIV
ncbi:MAG: hypothetical protein AAF497_07845 [Planctomycetota bacterium]